MALNHQLRANSQHVEKIIEEPFTSKTAQSTVILAYQANIAGYWRNTTVQWSKYLMNHSLSLTVDSLDGFTHYICKIDLKPWHFWSKRGSKSFDVEGNPVDVYWDMRSAKFSAGPEPTSDYYVALVSDNQVVLLLGDLKKKAYKKTKSQPALVDAVLFYKKENIFAKKSFSTRAQFDSKKREHDIVVESSTSGNKDPEMWISIDGLVVIHVKNLQWKFRGNQTVNFNRHSVEVFWDVHDWLFSTPGSGHGLFIFKPCPQEIESDRDGNSSLGGGSSTGAGSSISADSVTSSDSKYFSAVNLSTAPEFCLFLYAWKIE